MKSTICSCLLMASLKLNAGPNEACYCQEECRYCFPFYPCECEKFTPSKGSKGSEGAEEILFVRHEEIFTNLEFLYWTVEEGASDYALKMKHPAWGPTPSFAQGRYQHAQYDWRPGLRVLLGWYNEPKYWEIMGQYTCLYNRGRDTASKPSDPNLYLNPTWDLLTPPPFARAKSHLSLHYHVGDLLIARVFDPNPHLRIDLVGGLTTTYIEQKWKIRYQNFSKFQDMVKNRWRYFGGGIRFGITVDWFWGNHFYMTGKTAFASLLGSYVNHAFQRTTFNPSGINDPQIPVRNARFKDHRFVFHSQFILGPSWQRPYDGWHIEIFAGYEFNIWLNIQEVFRSTRSAPAEPKETRMENGVFGLHGLTARLTLGF